MSTALQSSLNGLLTPDFVSQTADALGETGNAVSKAMSAIFPAMIGSLGEHADDETFMSSVYEQVSAPENDPGILGNPARLLGKAAMALPAMMLGNKFLKMMFGPKVKDLGHDVSGYAGVRDASAQSMLGIAAPLVLGALGRLVRAGNMNVQSLTRLLRGESREAHRALPGALSHLERYSSIPPAAPAAPGHRAMQTRVQHVPVEEKKSGIWGWLAPLLLAAAVIWLLSTLFRRADEPAEVKTAPAAVDLEQVEIVPPPRPEPEPMKAAAPVADPDRSVMADEPRPGTADVDLDVDLDPELLEVETELDPEAEPAKARTDVVELEPQLIEAQPPASATADPDTAAPGQAGMIPTANVFFGEGSSELPSDVDAALLSVVTYMKANPSSSAMISTQHSSEGDLEASKTLATARASAVREELLSSGIQASRIQIMNPVEVSGVEPDEDRVRVRVRRSDTR